MKNQIELNLGIFKGFYGSHISAEIDNYIDNDLSELGKDYNDCDIEYNFKALAIDIFYYAKAYYLDEFDFLSEATFKELSSPKYYNYSNDKIYFNCDIDKELFLKWFNEVISDSKSDISEAMIDNIIDTHTSCSGFTSFHSNNISDWINDINQFNLEDDKTIYKIGFVIEAYIESKESFNDYDWSFELSYLDNDSSGIFEAYEIKECNELMK